MVLGDGAKSSCLYNTYHNNYENVPNQPNAENGTKSNWDEHVCEAQYDLVIQSVRGGEIYRSRNLVRIVCG